MSNEALPASVLLLLDERARQVVEEGYDAPHDIGHEPDQLAMAGATYALPASARTRPWRDRMGEPLTWPWAGGFKPSPDDRLKELVKAGALIIAEIDRMILEEKLREHQESVDA